MNAILLESFRQRYSHIHPLLLQRSIEKAKTPGNLFDILEDIPNGFPLKWCEQEYCWKTTDLFSS